LSAEVKRILQEENLFTILNITSSSSTEDIRSAYKKLVKQIHPDRFMEAELKLQAEEAFKRVGVAFSTLQDPLLRKDYERSMSVRIQTTASANASRPNSSSAPPRPGSPGASAKPAQPAKDKQEARQAQAAKHYQSGLEYDRKNQLEDAIREYKEAIRIHNEVATYHSHLALALQKKGWTGYAQAEFKVALHFDPTDKVALKHYQPTAGQNGKSTGFKWLNVFRNQKNTRLGDILINLGHLNKDQLKKALDQQNDDKLLLGEILIRMKYIKPEHLAQALIHQSEAVKTEG